MSGRIVLLGGDLWQWDSGRQVAVPSGATALHTALVGDETAYSTVPDDGVADIPNVLLQSGQPISAWASDGERTIAAAKLPVRQRAKPPEYIYTATDVEAVETIVEDAVAKAVADLELDYGSLTGLPTIEEVPVVGDLVMADFGSEPMGPAEISAAFDAAE